MTIPEQDRALIEGFLRGNADALAQMDAWVLPVVRNRAWGLSEQHEDLRHDIYLKLIQLLRAESFRAESSLKTYVQATAKYTCLDAVRRARVRRTEELDAEPLVDWRDGPFEALDRRESERLCHRVLQALPEGCRALFLMVLQRELSYEQIATELSINLGTVRSRLARCRDKAVALRFRLLDPGETDSAGRPERETR